MLTISVKNFGPIAEGSVDLKPLTIFVGPSNTGKSYMATAVYAITKTAADSTSNFYQVALDRKLKRRKYFGTLLTGTNEFTRTLDALQKLKSSELTIERQTPELTVQALPEDVCSWLKRITVEESLDLRFDIEILLREIYGAKLTEELASRGKDPETFSLSLNGLAPLGDLTLELRNETVPAVNADFLQSQVPEQLLNLLSYMSHRDAHDQTNQELFHALLAWLSALPLTGFPSAAYYLPAARSGIVIARRPLAASLIQRTQQQLWKDQQVVNLPVTMADFLGELIRLERRLTFGRSNENLVGANSATRFIEDDLLEGKIDFDESQAIPFPEIVYLPTSERAEAGKFTLDQTSSMVSELAPLILFLKYLVRPGDLLILEEPESHLHPAAQRQLARGIVRLVNAGVKVLITTHSDIIISQINNLLALKQASPELIAEGGFEPEDFLSEDQVGAYLFRYSQELGGSETIPLEIDPDTGIDEDEFAKVFEAMYDETIALQRDRG